MKCKAKWNRRLGLWIVYCKEHDMQCTRISSYGKSSLPHDIAVNHARRYHKG